MKNNLKLNAANVFIALLIVFAVSSCKRAENCLGFNNDLSSDNSRAEFISDDAENMGNAAVQGQAGLRVEDNFVGSCAIVTHDSVAHIVTIDFGTVNCMGHDGRNRRGKIIINYTGHYFDVGSVKNFSFQDYYVNDNHVEGTRVVTNEGLNAAGHFYWSIVSAITVTRTDGNVITWNRTGEREMTGGQGTDTVWDDVYSITGTATGTRNGNAYTAEITTPLVRSLSCHFISSGVIQITPAVHSPITIDFGNGTCDNQATLTSNGNTHVIVIH